MIRLLMFFVLCLTINESQAQSIRAIDGFENNLTHPEYGATGQQLQRFTKVAYGDGISTMAGTDRPNPRSISNELFDQKTSIAAALNLSDFVWVFGQFVDHDITLVEDNPFEAAMINVPDNDEYFKSGSQIPMFRSKEMPGTGTSIDNPREHANAVTAFIDGSAIYGSDEFRASWLRTYENGQLKTSAGNLLPWNTTTGEFNDPKDPMAPFMADDTRSNSKLFVAGDIRANENPLLIAFHTLFVREHNRKAAKLKSENPSWSDEQIYQQARKYVGAVLQNIVYNEWLPAQGVKLPEYRGYNDQLNPSIMNEFSTAAFRLGHTLINSNIIRMNNNGTEIASGDISLKDAFFNPTAVLLSNGIEPYMKGMATQVQQEMDCKVVSDVRNFLFSTSSNTGLDLAAININRGRERGLPDYNTIRENFGLPRVNNFNSITKKADEALQLENVYGSVDNIDPWVGMLAEFHMPNALFGELIMTIIEKQFQLLRDGDRYYFENDDELSETIKESIRNSSLKDLIKRNTNIVLMQDNVFDAMPHNAIPNGPVLEKRELTSILYPNPTSDEFNIKIYLENEREVKIRIFDPSGREVISKVETLSAGENFMTFDLDNSLVKGLYNVFIDAGYAYRILRVVKE